MKIMMSQPKFPLAGDGLIYAVLRFDRIGMRVLSPVAIFTFRKRKEKQAY